MAALNARLSAVASPLRVAPHQGGMDKKTLMARCLDVRIDIAGRKHWMGKFLWNEGDPLRVLDRLLQAEIPVTFHTDRALRRAIRLDATAVLARMLAAGAVLSGLPYSLLQTARSTQLTYVRHADLHNLDVFDLARAGAYPEVVLAALSRRYPALAGLANILAATQVLSSLSGEARAQCLRDFVRREGLAWLESPIADVVSVEVPGNPQQQGQSNV